MSPAAKRERAKEEESRFYARSVDPSAENARYNFSRLGEVRGDILIFYFQIGMLECVTQVTQKT